MQIINPLPTTGRVGRRPQHSFALRHQAYVIQPFLLAPVLPGETMKNMLVQSRVVTDPIKNPLIGWWLEYYFFYVKHRDLTARDEFETMMLDNSWDAVTAGVTETTASTDYYFAGDATGAINWSKLCLQRVVEEYFRDEGVAWDAHAIDGMPICQINANGWWDSAIDATTMPTVDHETTDTDAEVGALEKSRLTWEMLVAQRLTNMSYEDYLRTFGIRQSREEPHTPELIRYLRDWAYPTNTIDPSDGSPTSAVSWAIAERADKDRFFSEPGFLFGVTVARPKVYMSGQKGSAAMMMDHMMRWLPAIMNDEPYNSLVQIADGAGPIQGTTNPYWVDLRDLLLYGDQFINFALTETDAGLVALPTAALEKKYVTDAMTDALFVGAANKIKQDGIVSLNILGRQVDQT